MSPNGLGVKFLGGFDGSVDLVHLKEHGASGDDLKKVYPLKTKVWHFDTIFWCMYFGIKDGGRSLNMKIQMGFVVEKQIQMGHVEVDVDAEIDVEVEIEIKRLR